MFKASESYQPSGVKDAAASDEVTACKRRHRRSLLEDGRPHGSHRRNILAILGKNDLGQVKFSLLLAFDLSLIKLILL